MDNDYLIWLKLDGKYVDMTEELYICLCYNVPEGSSRQGLIDSGGGRVVRWCWENFQCRGVLQFGLQ